MNDSFLACLTCAKNFADHTNAIGWSIFALLVLIVTLLGVDHPPIRDDGSTLGVGRTVLGLLSLLIPLVTFMPEPLRFE